MSDDLTSARVLADSIYANGPRLTTVLACYPRFIHSEVMTHRALSRNSASSRAIPVKVQVERIRNHAFVPSSFPVNRPGMSADEYIDPSHEDYAKCTLQWNLARDYAVSQAENLMQLGVHKQIASRLLEPFMWHTAIISGTSEAWAGVFKLRCHPTAQPEFRRLAEKMRDTIHASEPRTLIRGQWHLPLVGYPGDEELTGADRVRVSVARCARVSYLTHEGRRDIDADLGLFSRLQESGHLSPFEHAATPWLQDRHIANFKGWRQARQFVEAQADLPGESILARRSA